MPYIEIKTNVTVDEVKKAKIAKMLGEDIAILPGKSERWLMTGIDDGMYMTLAGDGSPCVIASVSIFGSASHSAYDKLTAKLCGDLGEALGVSADRIYVKYSEFTEWGWNGGNF